MTNVEHRYATVNGKRTHYLESGEGPCVVLLHGGEFGAGAEVAWRDNIEQVAAAGHRVIAPDMLGYGESAKVYDFENPKSFRMQHVAELLDYLEVDDAHFAANSAGGHLLLKVATRQLGVDLRMRSMTLISPAPPASEGLEILRSYDGTREHMRRILQVLFLAEEWWSERYVDERHASASARGAYEAVAASRLRAPGAEPLLQPDDVDYSVITVPTLVVVGEQDSLLFEDLPGRLTAQAADAELRVVPDAKHCAHLEQSEEFNRLFIDFLATSEAQAGETVLRRRMSSPRGVPAGDDRSAAG